MRSMLFAKSSVASMLILFSLLVVSCDPAKKYASEISEIDSCMAVLLDIEEEFNGIEFDSIAYMVTHVMNNEDSIKKYYHPDTASLDIGMRMNNCKSVRKSMKNVKDKEKQFGAEISALKTQFENLKEDILNGVLKDQEVADYLANEKEDLNNLNLSFTAFYDLQLREKRFFYSSSPIIDQLIVDLKNEAAQK